MGHYTFISPLPFVRGKLKIDICKIPHQAKYALIEAIAEKHNVSMNSLNSLASRRTHLRIRLGHSVTYLNEGFLLAVRDFKIDLRNKAQELYYTLGNYLKDIDIARSLAVRTDRKVETWLAFFAKGLFTEHDYSLTNLQIPVMLVKFVHYGEKILKLLMKRTEDETLRIHSRNGEDHRAVSRLAQAS